MHHNYIDNFAHGSSPIHRLDARAKLLAVLAYSAVLISFARHEVLALAPMSILPLAMLWLGRIPVWFAVRRVLILSPLVAMLCLAGPLYDHAIYPTALGVCVSGGYLLAGNIAIKFALGLMALTGLMCTTPFSLLLEAMRKMGVPRLLVIQLGFLYRYVFVLIDQAMRVRRARDFRGAGRAGAGRQLAAAGGMIGSLLIRTLERSEQVHLAMCARGYRGQSVSLGRLQWTRQDTIFLVVTAVYLLICRGLEPWLISGGLCG